MQRIGVFVCHCGSNIAATVDVKKVVEMALREPGVFHAEDYPYMCSEAGQSRIAAAIRERALPASWSVPAPPGCTRRPSARPRKSRDQSLSG